VFGGVAAVALAAGAVSFLFPALRVEARPVPGPAEVEE
jgi:hypothetical protein